MSDETVDVDLKLDRENAETIRDEAGSSFNTQLRNIEYEDHFLTFRRAGNHAPYLQKIIDYTDGRSLEFACGTGTQALAVAPYVGGTVGLELNRNRIELTYARGQRMDADTHFLQGDMFSLPFVDDTFSTSFNSGVFHHFDDDAINSLADEVTRVTDDYVILSVSNHWYPISRDQTTRRMKPHDYWADFFDSRPDLSLVEDGRYGNRLDAIYRGVTEPRPLWLCRWLVAGMSYPRSWYVFEVAD
jgi:SAM-dependent methyltransferase